MDVMEIIPISEAKDRLTEPADRAARGHDHFTLTRNGRPHAVIVSVAEWESLRETLEVLADPETRADLAEAATAEASGDTTTETGGRAGRVCVSGLVQRPGTRTR